MDKERRPIFALTFDPRLPSVAAIQAKHWRAMITQDQYLADVFPAPPLVAFRKQSNIRDLLIRSKVPPFQKRQIKRDEKI